MAAVGFDVYLSAQAVSRLDKKSPAILHCVLLHILEASYKSRQLNKFGLKIKYLDMTTILKSDQREFQESPNKIDNYRIFTDVSRIRKGVMPENLNFDLRQLNPDQYSAPFHFHRYAEELFMIISGAATLRTPGRLEIVSTGDLIFFEKGETGAHQLYNHTSESCVYLDIRTFIGYDIAEYPDSEKILIAPSFEIFNKNSQPNYFDGELKIKDKWKEIENKDK